MFIMQSKIVRAFSSLEILIVLSIIASLSLIFVSFGKNMLDEMRLQREIQHLNVFIATIRQQVMDYQSKWELWGYKDTQNWCLIAKPIQFDFMPTNCQCSVKDCENVLIYHPIEQTNLSITSTRQFYLITLFNGVRGRSKSNNFSVGLGKNCQKFIFNDRLSMRIEKVKC